MISPHEMPRESIERMSILEVIWEDPHGVAINKPAGLLTHPGASGSNERTLELLVREYLRPADPGSVYLGTVHRLDRPVSGVILWAKTPKAALRWSAQFAQRDVHKEYWAIVPARVSPVAVANLVWDDWLSRPDRSGQARVVPAGTPGALRAITHVEPGGPGPFEADNRFTWLKLKPQTGRTHQLRAQAAARGLPIVGDATYGSQDPFESGISLHSRTLIVEHPTRRELMTLTARLPSAWTRWFAGSG